MGHSHNYHRNSLKYNMIKGIAAKMGIKASVIRAKSEGKIDRIS